MATNTENIFLIRILSEDGEVILEDTDFAEEARFDWFDENLRQAKVGETVQLIDTSDDRVLVEEIHEDY